MSKELDTQAQTAEVMPIPDVTDNALQLLQKQAEAMGAAHKIATVMAATSVVPATFRGKPDDAAAAILYGAELGLKPLQSLQQVFVIHGQPAIYARTMAGLLKGKGYRFITVESSPKKVTVTGTSPRGEEETASWTIGRAEAAGYTKNAKYKTDPEAMLYAKALAEVCRKLAPDVLLGISYTAEDLELESKPVRATATRVDSNTSLKQVLEARKHPEPEATVTDDGTDSLVDAFLTDIDAATTLDEVMRIAEEAHAGKANGVFTEAEYAQIKVKGNAKVEQLKEAN